MAKAVNMPKLGLQMTSGLITEWYVAEGDIVKEGEAIFAIETDKLTTDVESTEAGTVLKIAAEAGEQVDIMKPCCYVGNPGEQIEEEPLITQSEVRPPEPARQHNKPEIKDKQEVPARIFATPLARKTAGDLGLDIENISGSGPRGRIVKSDVVAEAEQQRVKITPLARVLAEQQEIDYKVLKGSGPGGRIVKEDILRAVGNNDRHAVPETTAEPLSPMRAAIAARLSQSKQTVPHAYFTKEVDASALLAARENMMAAAVQQSGCKLSVNDLVLKAVAIALHEFSQVNASCQDDTVYYYQHVNLGMAVSVEKGLIVPVIKNAEEKSMVQISREASQLARKARAGKLMPDEFTGGTFTVTNLGSMGIDSFQAIINPPEAGILAVGAITRKPVACEETVVIRPMMTLTGSFDHRIIDGALAAQFMGRVAGLLEDAYGLFLS